MRENKKERFRGRLVAREGERGRKSKRRERNSEGRDARGYEREESGMIAVERNEKEDAGERRERMSKMGNGEISRNGVC